jgi:hypothetical protein
MRIFKFISFIVILLLITVLFGYLVSIPTPAQSDAMQFSTKESAASAYYYRTAYDVNDSYVGSNITIVGVNVVSKVSVVGAPAVCAQAANSIDLFIDGTDGALWWEHWDGQTWGTWKSLGGSLTSDPAAVSRSAGKIDVFVRGTDGALWQRATTDGGTSWSNWYKIGGQLLAGTGPAAYAWGDARIGVFVTGTNKALYHIWNDGAWSSWQNLGGVLTSSPAATSPTSGVTDVYGRGTDGALWQREYNNAWSGWQSLGGRTPSGTGPAACSWGPGRLDVFVQGTDGALWHKSYNSAWSGWESLGGKLTSSPAAAAASGGNRIDAFVRGTDGAVWQKSYYNGGWSAWRSAGGGIDTGLNQGIANDGTYNYGITTTGVYKYDANWGQIAANQKAGAQVGVNHLGDGCVYNGVLYVAACDWAGCGSWGNSRIGKWNTSDLSYIGYVDISAQNFDAAGCSIDTTDGYLWVCSFCNADGTYYKYNLSDLSYVGSITPSPAFTYVQGIEYYGGHLFVSVLDTGIIKMDINGSGQIAIITHSALNTGEIEGLDVNKDYIRVLCGNQVYTFVNNY